MDISSLTWCSWRYRRCCPGSTVAAASWDLPNVFPLQNCHQGRFSNVIGVAQAKLRINHKYTQIELERGREEVKMMKFVLDGSRYKEVNICTKPQHWNNEINSDFLYQNGPHSSDCLLKTELQQGLCKSSRLVLDWTHPWIPLLERKLTLRKLKKK